MSLINVPSLVRFSTWNVEFCSTFSLFQSNTSIYVMLYMNLKFSVVPDYFNDKRTMNGCWSGIRFYFEHWICMQCMNIRVWNIFNQQKMLTHSFFVFWKSWTFWKIRTWIISSVSDVEICLLARWPQKCPARLDHCDVAFTRKAVVLFSCFFPYVRSNIRV